MAITLDELLGRNTTQTATEIFPSYEEFSSSRNRSAYSPARNESYAPSETYSESYARPTYSVREQAAPAREIYEDDFVRPARQQSFYEYVAHSNSRIDDSDLYDRLSRSNESMRPVFDRESAATAKREGLFTRSEQNVRAQQKVHGRLNTKGKIIVGSFLAAVVTVMSLIIAFAGKINSGTAVVPASNAAASTVSISQTI